MASCDLAISAAGGTLAELAYLGRPTLAIAIVPDQVANARRHVEAGLVAGGWPLAAVSDRELADGTVTLKNLGESHQETLAMADAAKKIVAP